MRAQSIRTRLIALLLVATIIPVLLSMGITYAYTKESLKNRSVKENANLLFQAKTNLVNYMNTAKEVFQARLYVVANRLTTLNVHDSTKRSVQQDNEVKFPPGIDAYVETSHPSSYFGMKHSFPIIPLRRSSPCIGKFTTCLPRRCSVRCRSTLSRM